MDEFESIMNDIESYEAENGLQDYAAPDEDEDIELTPGEYEAIERLGNKLPPLMEGRTITSSMINFAYGVTKAYRLCYAQFVSYVDNTPQLATDELGYITRYNVDIFFINVISKRVTSGAVNRRYVSALQKYAIYWEDRINFQVDSPVVKKALDDAKAAKKKYHTSYKAHVDAHKHRPTLHHSVEQEHEMIDAAFLSLQASKNGCLPIGVNLLISWNCSMQAFTRGDEVRNCRLPDLCWEINYGPFRVGDAGVRPTDDLSTPKGILSIIQQPFGTKIASDRAHVVGFFRHRDWRRCATSIISFSIMARFYSMTTSRLNEFFAIGHDGVPNWYNYFLIDWRDYDSMSKVFKKFFTNCGIAYTKLTHTRKLGIIRAHQLGADRENIILLSKHTVHKIDNSYLPELPHKAMLACAGFDVFRKEEYFIPRSYIQVPVQWISKIFPHMDYWKNQVTNNFNYDNGLAAKNFVYHLLPFFATIIVQDGVHLTTTYPDHPYSKLLLHILRNEGYEEWSQAMINSIKDREIVIEENWREDRKYEAVLRTAEKAVHNIHNLDQKMNQKFNEIAIALQRHLAKPVNVTDVIETGFQSTVNTPQIPCQARQVIEASHSPVHQPAIPSVPIIPPNIHKTIVENLEFWLEHQLWVYMNRGEQSLRVLGWDANTQFRFCKRRDIALWVKVVAEKGLSNVELSWGTDNQIILEVAQCMDEERGTMTVSKALQEFKCNNELSWVRKRRKRNARTDATTTSAGIICHEDNVTVTQCDDNTNTTSVNVAYQIQFTESTDTESESDNLPLSSLTR